jgi:hypothetical protein
MSVDLARQQWEDGYRRIQGQASDRALHSHLLRQVDVVLAELRRRLGGRFTLAELADEYQGSERWAHEAIENSETGEEPTWARWVSTATDAAFHRYARGAQDYRP